MKKLLLLFLICAYAPAAWSQNQTQLYDLVKKLLYDSTGYENVGDWAVGAPRTYPVSWKADRIEMSDDTSINFFRQGTAQVLLPGQTTASKWSVMLKGARSGYSSFTLVSPSAPGFHPRATIDSLFGKKAFRAKLLKSCERPANGFYYYEVKMPKKDVSYLKLSWQTANGNTSYRIDGYDSWSKQAVKTDCK